MSAGRPAAAPPRRPAISIRTKLAAMVAMFLLSAAGTVLIVALAFTVASGVRAYIGAESLWSKGQKDAVRVLLRALDAPDSRWRPAFDAAIAIPLGDRAARLALEQPDPDPVAIYRGFIAGGVATADVPEMMFLYRNFGRFPFVAEAIAVWAESDAPITALVELADRLQRAQARGALSAAARQRIAADIDAVDAVATPLALRFSAVLNDGARRLQWLLIAAVLTGTALLLLIALAVAGRISRDLRASIDSLRDATQRMASGDLTTHVAIRSRDELGALAAELNEMIDRRREVEAALKAATEFRDKVMDNATNAIYTLDRDGRFTTANRRTCEITGYALDELLDQRWTRLFADRADLDRLLPRYRDMVEGGRPIADHLAPITRKDGAVVTLRFAMAALTRDGEIFAVVGAAEDVTERLRDEAELKARAEELARSNRELEQFAYVASHDLQEPLRTVSGFAQLLQRRYGGRLDADADEYIGYVTDGVQRMKSLIEDLLAYSRVARSSEPPQPIDLNRAVASALANLKGAIDAADARLVVAPLPTLPGNERQLVQLFQNLIGNAVKFRSDAPPQIEIGAERDGGDWEITVRDNGIGIDPKHAEQVFVLFQRLNERGKYPGNGIGLTICKKIVDLHHGRIRVEPANPGTRFTIRLPA